MENEIVIFNVSPLKDNKKAVVYNQSDRFVLDYEGEAFEFKSTSEFYRYFYYRFFINERTKSDRLREAYEKKIEHCGVHEYSTDNYFHILTVKVSPLPEGINVAFGKDLSEEILRILVCQDILSCTQILTKCHIYTLRQR